MCTAISYKTKDHYFGRNLDLEYSYDEKVTIMPRNFPLKFRHVKAPKKFYAMIGMATVVDNYPLFYEATNEAGLSMAGLNFPGNADYKPFTEGKDNVSPFEFIPWILGQCRTVKEAKKLLCRLNLLAENFSETLPLTPLHWMISDREESVVVESVSDGLKTYVNQTGVLTNNPTFDYQMFNLNNYLYLSTEEPVNSFSKKLDLKTYSRGMGALGLPGDLSSASRFVKAVFTKMNSFSGESESESISQFFHILGSVEQQRGLVHMGEGKYEITLYSSCCNTDHGIYYYRTYENSQISSVNMKKENLDGEELKVFPLVLEQQIKKIN